MYAELFPDEPFFILMARDKYAPTLLRILGMILELEKDTFGNVREVRSCAHAMEVWFRDNK